MKIYYFGNQDYKEDSATFEVVKKIESEPWIEKMDLHFVYVKPNQDLPFIDEDRVIILDVVDGLEQVTLIKDSDLDKLKLFSSTSAHDFDLGFQIKYLKKLGKLGKISIIGIPMTGMVNYDSIQSIVKKLVAQDMQGS